jgi:dolichol-phosphate mannosyltransferase
MNTPTISIIVPTYNEALNIEKLLDRLHGVLNDIEHEVIVVDDDSPDRTWEIVEKRSKVDLRLRVIKRKDRGLSKAVIAGFDKARGDLMGVIDADLQHDERILPDMVAMADSAPIVVGSRYTTGGAVGDWKFNRRLKSWVATKLAALILNVSISDPMSGFFIVRREIYHRIKFKLNPEGFKILLEILFQANVDVAEIPYHFRSRLAGESKLSSRVVIEYLKQLIRLRRTNGIPTGFIKYCLVGASGVIVDMLVFGLGSQLLRLSAPFAGTFSTQVAVISNFILNNAWTFSERNDQPVFSRFIKYQATCFIGIVIKFFTLLICVKIFYLNPYLANGVGIIFVVFINFILSKLWVWKAQREIRE